MLRHKLSVSDRGLGDKGKLKMFSIGQTLVGSTNLAIGVAKQMDRVDNVDRVDRAVAEEENQNLVKPKDEDGEKCYKKKGEGIALAPALVSSGKLAKDVVEEASRFVRIKPLRLTIVVQVEGDKECSI